MAELDPATGLMTRHPFELALQDRSLQAGEKGLHGCLLHVGTDGLRLVMDDAGPTFANKVLTVVAARLRSLGGPSTLLARVAGDEFAIWLDAPRAAGEIWLVAALIGPQYG